MTIAPQSLRSMHTELLKLSNERMPAPEERLTPSRRKQMLKDAPIVIGSMGLGWGIGKTLNDTLASKAIKNPKTLAKVRKYMPRAMGITATGLGLVLAKQHRTLSARRDRAERIAIRKKALNSKKEVIK